MNDQIPANLLEWMQSLDRAKQEEAERQRASDEKAAYENWARMLLSLSCEIKTIDARIRPYLLLQEWPEGWSSDSDSVPVRFDVPGLGAIQVVLRRAPNKTTWAFVRTWYWFAQGHVPLETAETLEELLWRIHRMRTRYSQGVPICQLLSDTGAPSVTPASPG